LLSDVIPAGTNNRSASLLPSDHTRRSAADRQVPESEDAYVATGHSVWGILNGPATGEAVAELIAAGSARTTDLAPFDPARLRPR
jgi:glycine/D-amino acid oxidase-like deaminating enzyme